MTVATRRRTAPVTLGWQTWSVLVVVLAAVVLLGVFIAAW